MEMLSQPPSDVIELGVANRVIEGLRGRLAGLSADTPAGYEQVKAGIAEVRKIRTGVEKARKELKASALEYGRKVDAEAKRVTGLLREIEDPLRLAKEAVDEELENAKRAKKEEADRREREAAEAKAEAERKKLEAERKELEAERAEQERIRQEEVEKLRKEREQLEAERRAMEAERKAKEDAERKEREAKEAEQREIAAEKARKEREAAEVKAEAERKAEAKRVAKERRPDREKLLEVAAELKADVSEALAGLNLKTEWGESLARELGEGILSVVDSAIEQAS